MNFYAPFVWPFVVCAALMAVALAVKFSLWLARLPRTQWLLLVRGLPTWRTARAVWEVVRESLLHARIWRANPLLGYMHTSFALGWFLLIAVGWLETTAYVGWHWVPLQGHVFFKYFGVGLPHKPVFDFLMDLLLLFVLSGVALAWGKRVRSRWLGMRRTTHHFWADRVALSALWFIFPLRLIAEASTAALYGGGSFLTGHLLPVSVAQALFPAAWWAYSIALGAFFLAMPFSRYMHIFTEIPLIFLRRYGLRSTEKSGSYDDFQVQACSRCGLCIDPCQLQSTLSIDDVQSVYFLRDRRYKRLELKVANNCLMCGRCEAHCPVGIELNTLRLNSRDDLRNVPDEKRYEYLHGVDTSSGSGRVGYFAGCMTLLTPRVMTSMERIFDAASEDVWWADRDGGVCCGRPLWLAGETDSARKMMDFNAGLFRAHGISVLVTSCPICLRVFREQYALPGIEVLHHSQYIARLLAAGRLVLTGGEGSFTYHDPCELGRGAGIYEAPRTVLRAIGELREPAQTRSEALCCGSSLANTALSDGQQLQLARAVGAALTQTGAAQVVTACPLCKKALARGTDRPVVDLAEAVAEHLS